ncbi:MAG: sulfatase-like hydrolase/transferase [Planctomycetota bacterium]
MTTAHDGTRRPNILVFVTDDQTHRSLHAVNNPEVHTPNLDRLASRGTTFTHAHHQGSWTGAVCIASRAMLLTGRMLFRCGGDTCGDYPLVGQALGGAGYDTFCVGKWHNFGTSRERCFAERGTEGPGMWGSTPFDFQKNTPEGDPAQSAYLRPSPGNVWTADDRTRKGHWFECDPSVDPTGYEHSSTHWANELIGYLDGRNGSGDRPFFAYCAMHAPHDPRQAPTEFLDMYPLDQIEIPPNYLREHPFDQGDFDLRDEQLAPWPRTEEAVRVHRREYYAILSHMDAEIGRALDRLETLGLADNTIVVLTADHGLAVGEHGLMGKQNMYDHSVRVPLVFAGPGVPAGVRRDQLVYQHSLYATLCALAGVEAPETVDFPSLVPGMHDPMTEPHETAFCAYRDFQRMCRDKTHKLIVYPHLGRWQLFNTVEDPYETRDLALDQDSAARYRPIIDRLLRSMLAWQERAQDELALDPAALGLA